MLNPTLVVLNVEEEENNGLFTQTAFAKEGLGELLRTVNQARWQLNTWPILCSTPPH